MKSKVQNAALDVATDLTNIEVLTMLGRTARKMVQVIERATARN